MIIIDQKVQNSAKRLFSIFFVLRYKLVRTSILNTKQSLTLQKYEEEFDDLKKYYDDLDEYYRDLKKKLSDINKNVEENKNDEDGEYLLPL